MADNDSQKWFSLEVNAEHAAADAIEHALNELDALGTEINHLRRRSSDAVKVIGYFHELPDDQVLQDELHHALRIYDLDEKALKSVERKEVVDQDWLEEWKKHWKPTEIGRFIIAPSWENIAETDSIVIRIEPNMAFGTGTHETTQLCLKAIDENYFPGQSFLDVGTGTGILSIAAAKLNGPNLHPKFYACDTDANSISIARDNAKLNDVTPMIEFHAGPISDETPVFDFVCANLTIDVILPILTLLLDKASETLVLSGILIEQEATVVNELVKNGVDDLSIERDGEWIAVIIKTK